MRERIGVGIAAEVGRGRPERPARRSVARRRPGAGPRPVRPAASAGAGSGTAPGECGRAVLGRRAGWRPASRVATDGVRPVGRPRVRVAHAAAGSATYGPAGRVLDVARALVVVVLTALVVVGLGMLADAVSVQRAPSPSGFTVTQEDPPLNR